MSRHHESLIWGLLVALLIMGCCRRAAAGCISLPADIKEQQDSLARQVMQNSDSIRLLVGRGDYLPARKLAEQNIETARAANRWDIALQGYETLIAIDSATRNFDAALKNLRAKEQAAQKLYAIQKDEILNDDTQRRPTETLYRQVAEIEDGFGKTEDSIRFRAKLIAALSIVGCLLLAAAIVQIYRYESRRRVNNSLLAKNDRSKIHLEELARFVNQFYDDNQQLTLDNDRMEKANAVKDTLLSIISHDLRSPMSSLQALLNLFNTNNIARADLVDFFGKLLSRVENTSTMLENLLHWSQYQLKGIEPLFDSVDLQKIIDECINLYRMHAEQKHIVIDNSLKTNVYVCADVEMLKVVLRNLISNALKFTRSGGIITIKAMTGENHVIISVRDTGVGISPENQAKMFTTTNFTTPGTEKEKGTGLGLLLCRDFVEHNHGKIWLDSKVNAGTTFYFTVPLAAEQMQTDDDGSTVNTA
jgi:signal transduction histidine kinase